MWHVTDETAAALEDFTNRGDDSILKEVNGDNALPDGGSCLYLWVCCGPFPRCGTSTLSGCLQRSDNYKYCHMIRWLHTTKDTANRGCWVRVSGYSWHHGILRERVKQVVVCWGGGEFTVSIGFTSGLKVYQVCVALCEWASSCITLQLPTLWSGVILVYVKDITACTVISWHFQHRPQMSEL